MKKKNKILSLSLLLLSFFSSFSCSIEIADLYAEDRLRIETTLENKEDIAVGEQTILKVKISTDTWFAAGTRLEAPRIKDAISLKQNKLSTNITFRENGKTWAAQIWEITIYPQKTGEFYIPSIPVEITIAESSKNKVNGVLLTEPKKFNTILPNGFITKDIYWLSASKFVLKEEITKPETEEVKVGDAIIRKIKFKAEDTVSMLFPKIKEIEVKGTKSYLSKNKNKDQSTRGNYIATREQKITYIIQESGEIKIPEIDVYWWDIDNKEWKKETLPSFKVLSKHTPISWIKSHIIEIFIGITSIILILLLKTKIYKGIRVLIMTDTVQFYKCLLLKDIKNINKLNYKKLKKVNDSILLKNQKTIKHKHLLKWEDHYSESSNEVSRKTLFEIRRSIK